MKHVSILVPIGEVSVVNIMGSYQLLEAANQKFKQATGDDLFSIDIVGFDSNPKSKPGTATVTPTVMWTGIQKSDLIIIPAIHQDATQAIAQNKELIDFLVFHYKQGATLASLCVGAYLLAATGLMKGINCSIHWQHAPLLKTLFPEVIVTEEKIITDQNGIITSGGAYAFTNLVLYLIEKYGSRELAVVISKLFMIDIDRLNQSVYFMFQGKRQHSDETVLQVQEYIENNYSEKFTVDKLASDHHLVRRTLERRFKSTTGHSILEYMQKVRIESAKKNLEIGRKSITEIMYDCGYNDSKAFRDTFKKYVGISPLEYRQKFTTLIKVA